MNNIVATRATLLSSSVALFTPAKAVDKALASSETAKQTWALCAATLLLAADSGITMETVAEDIVAAARSTVRGKAKQEAIQSMTDVSKLVSSTVAGWYYDLRRAERNGLLPLLLEGKSLTGLRRATESTQKPSARKGKGKAAATPETNKSEPLPVIAPTSLEHIAQQLEGDAKRMTGRGCAANATAIARIVAAATTLARKAESHAVKAAKAAAAKPAPKAKAKAAVA